MKGGLIAGILLLALASCERNEVSHPGDASADKPSQGLISKDDPAGKESGKDGKDAPKTGDAPVLVERKPPVAEPAPGQPGKVISPFNGQLIDVAGIEPGTLVADPTYPPEAKKHFRVPEMPAEGAPKPPAILDPSILIRPKETPEKP